MNDANNINDVKSQLLSELYKFNNLEHIDKSFEIRFFKLIELVIFSLMKGEDNFFALFTIQMKREIKMNLETAVASSPQGTYFILYFNPFIFLHCTLKEMQALLKHEVYHIMSLHHLRAGELRRRFSSLAVNLAMDISINQYIVNLPLWSEKLENVRISYNVDLKDDMPMEQYAEAIQDALDRLRKDKDRAPNSLNADDETQDTFEISHNIDGSHDMWNAIQDTLDKEEIKETIRNMAGNSSKGKLPPSIEGLMASLNSKPEINWSYYLKRFMGSLPAGYKKTVTRKDRRQPERLDLRGKLPVHAAEIVVAIDISGSVTDKEIEKIMTEVLSIIRNYHFKLTVIECDSEIKRIYEAKTVREVRQKLDTKGGTRFSPVFKYLKDKGKNSSILIYFTDGLGEVELDTKAINYTTLWVLTGKEEKLSLSNPPGIVKRLSPLKKQSEGILALEYLKNELQDQRSEWAK